MKLHPTPKTNPFLSHTHFAAERFWRPLRAALSVLLIALWCAFLPVALHAQSLEIIQLQSLNGAQGTSFVLYGSGFDTVPGDNTVTFTPAGGGAGTTATVTAASSTKLTVTVPSVTGGNYTVSVQRASDGAMAASAELFGVATGGGDFGAPNSSERVVISSSSANAASSVYAADVDGDGDLDLLLTKAGVSNIIWYENDGGAVPTFTARFVSTTADGANSIHAADVDGDGDIDLLTASFQDDKIVWHENDGAADPSFTAHTVSTTADGARDVYAADVDGDGDIDLLSASQTDDKIAWYENDGAADPSFTARTVSTTVNGAFSVHAADVDGDGDIDLLSASQFDDKIAWYENNGAADPSFTARTVTTAANGASSVHAADVDGDGDIDLLSASANDDKIAWYENDGAADPTFTARTVSTTADGATSVYAADVDGDGDIDLLSASANDDKIAWYENDGAAAPTFTAHTVSTNADNAFSVYAADVDGDGDIDLMSASQLDGKIAWYENATTPLVITQLQSLSGAAGASFTIYGTGFAAAPGDNTVTFTPTEGGSGTTASVTAVSSTKLSVTVPAVAGGNYTVSVQRASDEAMAASAELFGVAIGGGDFGATGSSERAVSTTADGAVSVYAADVDGDGDIDLLSASFYDNKIAWYENNGAQNFTERVVSTTVNGARSVYAADVDGDGDIDLLSASQFDDEIAWYENDGAADPSFTAHTVSTTADGAFSVYAADVDGDGDIDLLSASKDDDKIAWYENDGAQNFTERVVSTTANGARSIHTTDVDGDGDIDLLSASFDIDRIVWYENDGAQNFTERVVSSAANGAHSVYAADVDGDGDIDLMSASRYDNKIAWYENDGAADPTFTSRTVTTAAAGAHSVYAADVDGDGYIDLLSASYNDDKIAWYENDGAADPTFTAHTVTTAANAAEGVYAADVDGDGDLDLLSASFNDDKIAWYENAVPVSIAGQSLAFSEGEIEVPHNAIYNDLTEMTIELWVNPENVSFQKGLVEKHVSPSSGWWTRFLDGGRVQALFVTSGNNPASTTSASLQSNEWQHVAVRYDGSGVQIFIDGIDQDLVTETLGTGTVTNNTNPVRIGNLNWFNGRELEGNMDEVRIWNKALSAEEIQQNMFQQLNGDETGLIAYYPFDETEGGIALDKTANENHGSLGSGVSQSNKTHPYGTFITGSEGWRMMSVPVEGATYGEILDPLWTQGFTGSDSPDYGASNVYYWDEENGQFASIADAGDIPPAGAGFITYVYDDVDFDETLDGFPKEIRTDSTQTSGSVSPTLSCTDNGDLTNDGWNLLGNPYGATIDWDASGWTATNLDASFYIWNADAGEYQSWNGTTGTLPSEGLIAPWQGFWVKANAADPSISFSDDIRSAGGVLLKQAPIPQLRFTISDGRFSNDAIVMLSEDAQTGKDRLDAYKLQSLNNEYLSLFTQLEDGTALDINALSSELEEPITIPLNIDGSDLSGAFELSWQPEALPENWEFVLRDTLTGQQVDLQEQSAFSVELEGGTEAKAAKSQDRAALQHKVMKPNVLKTKSSASKRFTLTITSAQAVTNERLAEIPSQVELQQNYPNPFNPTTTINYGVPEAGEVSLEVFDMLGRKVATLINREAKSAGRHTVQFDAARLASGMYIYRLKAGTAVITKKLTLIK